MVKTECNLTSGMLRWTSIRDVDSVFSLFTAFRSTMLTAAYFDFVDITNFALHWWFVFCECFETELSEKPKIFNRWMWYKIGDLLVFFKEKAMNLFAKQICFFTLKLAFFLRLVRNFFLTVLPFSYSLFFFLPCGSMLH